MGVSSPISNEQAGAIDKALALQKTRDQPSAACQVRTLPIRITKVSDLGVKVTACAAATQTGLV